MRGEVLRPIVGEPEDAEDPRQVSGERAGGRVALAGQGVELGLGDLATAELVPEVVGLERAPESLVDLGSGGRRHR